MMKSLFFRPALAASLAALTIGGAIAQSDTAAPLPPVQMSGPVEYLSGGIGQGEAKAIELASTQWPLTLEFAINAKPRAVYAANVVVAVRDAKGNTALETTANGPFLLVKLEPGTYAVEATFGGKTLHEKVVIMRGRPAKAVFVWPSGTGDTHS